MRLLLSNDDGIEAEGLRVLASTLARAHEVWVVAPDQERSAQSHALTLHQPLRAKPAGARRYAVSGTPADCIYLGLHGLIDVRPDFVLSGINHGSNLGTDVFYSGTVAAAREAVLHGVPAIAVSLHHEGGTTRHFRTAAEVAERVLAQAAANGLPPRTLLNVNVPNVAEVRGIAGAVLGVRTYANRVERREDPFGGEYFWIGGKHVAFDDIEGSDGPLLEEGWATVTPMHSDATLHRFMEPLRDWFDV